MVNLSDGDNGIAANQDELQEKLTKLIQIEDDDLEKAVNDWELNFLTNLTLTHEETDFMFSVKQATALEQIYEKCWRQGLV